MQALGGVVSRLFGGSAGRGGHPSRHLMDSHVIWLCKCTEMKDYHVDCHAHLQVGSQ